MRGKAGALGVAALAVAAAGCGGSGRLSKQDFSTKANGICKRYTAQVKGVVSNIGNTPESVGKAMNKAIPLVEQAVADLDDLKPPKGADAKFQEWQKTNREQIAGFRKIRDAANAKDAAKFKATATELDSTTADSDRLARELGLDSCAD